MYNSSSTKTTKISPNYANYRYDPVAYKTPLLEDNNNKAARIYIKKLKTLYEEMRTNL